MATETETYTDDRPTFADFCGEHRIGIAAELAPLGTVKWADRVIDHPKSAQWWQEHLGVARSHGWTQTLTRVSPNKAKAEQMIPVKDYEERDTIDLWVTLTRADETGKEIARYRFAYGVGAGNCVFTCPGSNNQESVNRYYWDMGKHWIVVYCPLPDVAEVVATMARDSQSVTDSLTFEEWADEYGYDTDSRKAEKVYKAVQEQAAKFRKFLGHSLFASATSGDYQED